CCAGNRVRPVAWWWRLARWRWLARWRLARSWPWRHRHRRGDRPRPRRVRARQRGWRLVSLSVLRLWVPVLWLLASVLWRRIRLPVRLRVRLLTRTERAPWLGTRGDR